MDHFRKKKFRSEKFKITANVIQDFAEFSSDENPIHLNDHFAIQRGYSRSVSHGVIQLAYLSKVIGNDFPGPGSVWLSQQVNWLSPVLVDDTIEILLTTKSVSTGTQTVVLHVEIINQNNTIVMSGEAKVKVTKEISRILKVTADENEPVLSGSVSKIKPQKNDNHARKVALVTGGTGGIGFAASTALAQSGFTVVVNHRGDKNLADALISPIRNSGGEVISVPGDVTNKDDVQHAKNLIIDKFGRCDAVVHCASPFVNRVSIDKLSYDDFSMYLDTFLKASFLLVEAFSKAMIEQKFGRLVFLGSSYIYGAPPKDLAHYVAAKEALWGYTKSLSIELAPYGITANMVSPSLTVTKLTAGVSARAKEVEAMKNPVRRLALVEDTAHQIAHLCSDGAGYINGLNFPVTGTPV